MSIETETLREHWDRVYDGRATTVHSWYEREPNSSLALIRASGIKESDPIIDVGGGASYLVDALLAQGFQDLAVLDISSAVLQTLGSRLGARVSSVALLPANVTTFVPLRRYALWHDRAVFHFLTDLKDRQAYVDTLKAALKPSGQAIIATFGPQGPQKCSGLAAVRYDVETLSTSLGDDFSLLESSLQEHRTPTGTAQQFLYCRFSLHPRV